MIDILLITNAPAPYKRPRFEELNRREGVNLTVLYANSKTSRHSYSTDKSEPIQAIYEAAKIVNINGSELMWDISSLKKIMSEAPDVIIVAGWNYTASWYGLLVSKLKSIPVLLMSANTSITKSFLFPVINNAVNLFDHYLALSSDAKKTFTQLGVSDNSVTILPNCIDVENFTSHNTVDKERHLSSKFDVEAHFCIQYVGLLEKKKGVRELVEAVNKMEHNSTKLILVGQGEDQERLETKASNLGVDAHFEGQKDRKELPSYYTIADVVVLPTHGDMWGMVLNEAMACGTPVVTTEESGAVGDLVINEDTGLVVPAQRAKRLAEALDRLAECDRLRKKLGQSGREAAEKYTPHKYADKLLSAIKKV
jgi:glycosyltransferase involved in cell wall biosynthesis